MKLLRWIAFGSWIAGAWAYAGPLPPIQTVFFLMLENHSWPDIRSNASAPYFNNVLLPMASYCEQYLNLPGPLHPSLPNYLWLEAGTNFGIFDDNGPCTDHQNTTNHLVRLLENAGVSWKVYQEFLTGTNLPLDPNGPWSSRHDPMIYFDDVTCTNNDQCPYGLAHIRPYSELAADLTNNTVARYNFIVPHDCDDMHSSCAPVYDSILQGDTWLSTEVPRILNSAAYTNGGALFVVFDETDGDARLPMLVISPFARGGGYASTVQYTHSSTLRTIQEVFNVFPLLGDAANATNLSDLFVTDSSLSKFEIHRARPIATNALELTITGVSTNAALVLESSTDLAVWTALGTNTPASASFTWAVTNRPGADVFGFYRCRQIFP